jgi:hypothetical protein
LVPRNFHDACESVLTAPLENLVALEICDAYNARKTAREFGSSEAPLVSQCTRIARS